MVGDNTISFLDQVCYLPRLMAPRWKKKKKNMSYSLIFFKIQALVVVPGSIPMSDCWIKEWIMKQFVLQIEIDWNLGPGILCCSAYTSANVSSSNKIQRNYESHHFIANRRGKSGSSDRSFFSGSKITAGSDCSHGIKKRLLLLGRKVMTNLDRILKSRDIT